jgi:hypothetical protein
VTPSFVATKPGQIRVHGGPGGCPRGDWVPWSPWTTTPPALAVFDSAGAFGTRNSRTSPVCEKSHDFPVRIRACSALCKTVLRMAEVPAGWYTDTERPGELRYWSGQQWTEYRHPGHQPAPVRTGATSAAATWALILGVSSLILAGVLSIPAVVLGHIALRDIAANPKLGGRGMALTGLIIGYATFVLAASYLMYASGSF